MNSKIERYILMKGVRLTRIELRNEHNRWIGNIIIESCEKASELPTGEIRAWGRYYSITDFGSFSHAWYFVSEKHFEDFIRECAEDAAKGSEYMLKKLCPEECNVFLLPESKEAAAERLCEEHEEGMCNEAYEAALDALECVSNEQELYDWYNDELQDPDGYENFAHGLSNAARGYRDNVLPLLAEVLRNEKTMRHAKAAIAGMNAR